ncbi:hypothetical protein C2G38_2151230 [Gigaspora rosea]|uniref:Uncharacterized protein n=1 Tax=Gigaspora rosea TaxID=44941 RepID=A0A397WA26_9GLOM|nr:hypothetical protein C2G38_2151230 [Gigaspora rosea]
MDDKEKGMRSTKRPKKLKIYLSPDVLHSQEARKNGHSKKSIKRKAGAASPNSNIEWRKKWCDQYKDKDVYFWRHVIFSDEMSVEVGPKQKINKEIYTKVLNDHLVPFVSAAHLLLYSYPIFQHDNTPVHKIVKDNIQNHEDFPKDKPALKAALTEVWSNLDTSVLRLDIKNILEKEDEAWEYNA